MFSNFYFSTVKNKKRLMMVMPRLERVDMRIWWFTVSKAAGRSSRMRNDDPLLLLTSGSPELPTEQSQ